MFRCHRHLLLFTTAMVPLTLGLAFASPVGPTVVGGNATVTGQGTPSVVVKQQSDKAIINWQSFNIAPGETTTFTQPSASSIALNRVTGNLGPSQILGTLTANGRIYLVNRDGILFGPGAVVDTAGFLATTNDIRNEDFMAGRYVFTTPGRPDASIVNLGTITAQNSGFGALVAPGVRNTGTISANLGTVALAAGNAFTLDFYGDKLIKLGIGDEIAASVKDVATGQPLNALVKNEGTLRANGGRVELTAAAARQVVDAVINNTGVIEANTVGEKGGTIVLGAATAETKPAGAPTQKVKVSGTLSAAGKNKGEKGGKVQITGEAIDLAGARIDASGYSGGGSVLVGGDVFGGRAAPAVVPHPLARPESAPMPNATTVSVDATTIIDASAKDKGDGGKVVVWADATTAFDGTIYARGGSFSGNGGFAEVSGRQLLNFNGSVDLRAPKGKQGTLLLDPYNLTIQAVGPGTVTPDVGSFTSDANNSILSVATLQNALALGDVLVITGTGGAQAGDITVASSITWGSPTWLTLAAYRNITLNDGVTIKLTGGDNGIEFIAGGPGGLGQIIFNGSGKFFEFSNPVAGTVSTYGNDKVVLQPKSGGTITTTLKAWPGSSVDSLSGHNNLVGYNLMAPFPLPTVPPPNAQTNQLASVASSGAWDFLSGFARLVANFAKNVIDNLSYGSVSVGEYAVTAAETTPSNEEIRKFVDLLLKTDCQNTCTQDQIDSIARDASWHPLTKYEAVREYVVRRAKEFGHL